MVFLPSFRFAPKLRSSVFAALSLLGLAVSAQAFAERADRDKPVVISADKGSGDDLNQTSIYTGNVVLTKGTILLRADQLTTRQDPEGYSYGTAIVTQPGKLAYFKQKREGVDEYIEGQAERIEYDEKTDVVKLFNRAIVKRLAAGRDADEIRGDRIDYNSRTDVYSAQSSTSGRVNVVLQPKVKPGASSAPGADNAPGKPAPSTPIDLKKDMAIEKKPTS